MHMNIHVHGHVRMQMRKLMYTYIYTDILVRTVALGRKISITTGRLAPSLQVDGKRYDRWTHGGQGGLVRPSYNGLRNTVASSLPQDREHQCVCIHAGTTGLAIAKSC